MFVVETDEFNDEKRSIHSEAIGIVKGHVSTLSGHLSAIDMHSIDSSPGNSPPRMVSKLDEYKPD